MNIALGYPLSESKIMQFSHCLHRLYEGRRAYFTKKDEKKNSVQTNTLEECFSFPFFFINTEQRSIFKTTIPYIRLNDIFLQECDNKKDQTKELILLIEAWLEIQSLEDLHKCILLLDSLIGKKLENPLDRYALYTLKKQCFSWSQQALFSEKLGYDLCTRILFERFEHENIPFNETSDSLLQVLAFHETHLLSFDTIYIFDANEDILPKKIPENPLLPEKLRIAIGLKKSNALDIAAHTWQRLVESTQKVHIYWQEGSAQGLENRKMRSSYVEEALWSAEKERQTLFNGSEDNFEQAKCPVELSQKELSIPLTDNLKTALLRYCAKNISATDLDLFLNCPLKFFYKKLCGFKEVENREEKEDKRLLGILVHTLMENIYPCEKDMSRNEITKKYVEEMKNFDLLLKTNNLDAVLPAESIYMLKKSFPYRIKKYIQNQPESTKALLVEKELKCLFKHINSQLYPMAFKGIVDRLDLRIDEYGTQEGILLDYKTGSLSGKIANARFWTKQDFFDDLSANAMNFKEEEAQKLLTNLYKASNSVQMPLYIFLTAQNEYPITNAAYIDFYDTCKEKVILPVKESEDIIKNKIPPILYFITSYLQNISSFSRSEQAKCSYCSFARYCN